jgi:hypothetical protein
VRLGLLLSTSEEEQLTGFFRPSRCRGMRCTGGVRLEYCDSKECWDGEHLHLKARLSLPASEKRRIDLFPLLVNEQNQPLSFFSILFSLCVSHSLFCRDEADIQHGRNSSRAFSDVFNPTSVGRFVWRICTGTLSPSLHNS